MSATTESAVRAVLTDFVHALDDALGGDGQHVERVLRGDVGLSRDDLDSEPEEWTEDVLIDELLEAVGLNLRPGRPNPRYETPDWVDVEIPDFEIEEGGEWIVGENKSVNNFDDAETDLQEYIGKVWWPNLGIATDGTTWGAYRVEDSNGESSGENGRHYRSFSRQVDLRNAIRQIAADEGVIAQQQIEAEDADAAIEEFVEVFSPESLVTLLRRTAPKELRDRRKADVDAFYELYIELLFGRSEKYDEEYDTHLRADVIQPDGVAEQDKDVFAVTLVNRLLFIKFLEKRGVLPESFLTDRVEAYNDELPSTLYKTVFEPLFFELLNTPVQERPKHQQTGWQGDVEYLNGGLFRETVPREREYDVENRTLPKLITHLVEGHELDFELDPAILGSVFEKTINHLSAEENLQKAIGAYYTPDDVTRLINRQTVGPKIREVIVETYADELTQEAEFRAEIEGKSLEEILVRIEDGRGWFGNDVAMEAALERVNRLKVVDPACGSGHFLTAAMDDLHAAQRSLYRGLHGGDDPDREGRYRLKKTLALNCIYGVDVDPVATEIAKLRVWLKIVEGNGWDRQFGELPNIDVNIVDGNSLIGLPEKGGGQAMLDAFDVDLSEIESVRDRYKAGEISRRELNQRIETLRPELDDQYLDRLNHYVDHRIDSVDEWQRVVRSLDQLYPTIRKVTVRRADGDRLADEQVTRLAEAGFQVEPRYKKSARVVEDDLDSVTAYSALLDEEFVFDVERQLVKSDLETLREDDLSYDPFHWVVEFPEVVSQTNGGGGYSVEFDVIVGNPPYGDVLTETELRFVRGYRTGRIRDIVMQFIERELHLLDEGGYFGNVHGMGILYQGNAAPARELLQEKLDGGRIASFGHRPATVFEGANPRAAITTGRKANGGPHDVATSDFVLFYPDERQAAFENVEYGSIDGLVLGDYIGDAAGNEAWPKVGSETARSILVTLRDAPERQIDDVMDRNDETEHVVYRSYHPLYWLNPFLENLYDVHGTSEPRDFEPMYFESNLHRDAAFVLLQSSTFYHYWMTYENQRDLNWGPIDAFPFPDEESLRAHADEIDDLAGDLWDEMKSQFNGREIPEGERLKPYADRADELLGPMLGLDGEQIDWLQEYHTEFGRGGPDDARISDYDDGS